MSHCWNCPYAGKSQVSFICCASCCFQHLTWWVQFPKCTYWSNLYLEFPLWIKVSAAKCINVILMSFVQHSSLVLFILNTSVCLKLLNLCNVLQHVSYYCCFILYCFSHSWKSIWIKASAKCPKSVACVVKQKYFNIKENYTLTLANHMKGFKT